MMKLHNHEKVIFFIVSTAKQFAGDNILFSMDKISAYTLNSNLKWKSE